MITTSYLLYYHNLVSFPFDVSGLGKRPTNLVDFGLPSIKPICNFSLEFKAQRLVTFNSQNQVLVGNPRTGHLFMFTLETSQYILTSQDKLQPNVISKGFHLLPNAHIVNRFGDHTMIFKINAKVETRFTLDAGVDSFIGHYGKLICVLPNRQAVYLKDRNLGFYALDRRPDRAHWKILTLAPHAGSEWSNDLSVCLIAKPHHIAVCDGEKHTIDIFQSEGHSIYCHATL